VDAYIAARLDDGAARATVLKEVGTLSRMLKLSLASAPRFTRLEIENTRTGSFTDDQLGALLGVLAKGAPRTAKDPEVEAQPDLVAPILFAAWTGWRMVSDVFTLQWSQVDFKAGTVTRWSRGTSKAGRHVVFPFAVVPALAALLDAQRERTSMLEKVTARIVPHVFHRGGEPIRDFYHAWRAACGRAGVPGRIPHDLRRTAARRLRTLGLSDRDIAEICGWDTVVMVERYLGRDPAGVAERLRVRLAEADERAPGGAVRP
jgi:integrase